MAFRKKYKLIAIYRNKHNKRSQKFFTSKQTTTTGQCTQFYTSRLLCYQQVLKTTTSTSTQTRKTFTIFNQDTCHRNFIMYLLEYVMCKIQYVEKSETLFNIRLNNHMIDKKTRHHRSM